MKSKTKRYLIVCILLAAIVFANLFSLYGLNVKADEPAAHFSSGVQPYATGAGYETVYFTDREDEYVETVKGVPLFMQLSELSNSCGPTAGAITVGFYDKYYEDLIPDFTCYYPATGKYKRNDKTYVPALMSDLYTLMRTNVDAEGVSEADCISGLRTYVQNKNHSINYTSLKSSSKLNAQAYFDSINNNRPVIIFAAKADLVSVFGLNEDHDDINKAVVNGNHVYVGYGYYTVKYYNESGNFRTDTYIKVATGMFDCLSAYIKIDSTSTSVSWSWFVNAYSIAIS